jgi:cellulose synthase/poly-beta-1,6-N-acetylglucosamine synthase-like glycosyltransferase
MIGSAAIEAVVAVAVVLPCLYLAVLAALSFLSPARAAPRVAGSTKVAVLIPAHDEQRTIEVTIASVARAAPDVAVHVVADNCSDRTAEIAAAAGACAHVRDDPTRTGKAAALNWLVREVLAEDRASEAFVVVDADTRVEPGFFAALRGRLERGASAVQGANLVESDSGRPLALLRIVAFHLRCELRPLAYERLGASAGLYGNGMCFTRDVLERFGWNERSLIEDHELHVRMVNAGLRVDFARGAVTRSLMPSTFQGAAGQAVRWESGSVAHFVEGLRLIASGVIRRRITRLVAGLEVVIPPLSLLVAGGLAAALLGIASGDMRLSVLGAVALIACAAYVARGVALAGIGGRDLASFALWVPAFVIWKLGIIVRAAAGGRMWSQARETGSAPGANGR